VWANILEQRLTRFVFGYLERRKFELQIKNIAG